MADALVVRHVAFEDLGILAPVLAQRGLDVRYWDAGRDDPAALLRADPDLLVVLGGPIGAFDDDLHPFLRAELQLLHRHVDANRPTLGICLGAQLIARTMGGRIVPGAPEIGWAPVDLTPAGGASVLAHLAGVEVLHWHGDRIVLPEGVGSLATTASTAVQAFETPRALGLQFHLEADPARIDQWLIGHAHEVASVGLDPRRIRADAERCGPALVPLGQEVIGDWLSRQGL